MSKRIYLCYNGEFLLPKELNITAENRSFKYGDGVFETFRCFGSVAPLFDLHYNRLVRALTVLGINIKSLPSREVLLRKIELLINKNKFFISSRIRLAVYRNEGGLYTPTTNDCSYVMEASPLETKEFTLNARGLVASDYYEMQKAPSPISPFKTSNSLLFVLAGLFKKKNSLTEVFIQNTDGKIIEALASNLFWFKNKYLLTISVSAGCVDGIMRHVVIKTAEDMGMKVIEIPGVDMKELMDADELFVTNSVQGINWIVGIDEKRFYNTKTIQLHRELVRRIRLVE